MFYIATYPIINAILLLYNEKNVMVNDRTVYEIVITQK